MRGIFFTALMSMSFPLLGVAGYGGVPMDLEASNVVRESVSFSESVIDSSSVSADISLLCLINPHHPDCIKRY